MSTWNFHCGCMYVYMFLCVYVCMWRPNVGAKHLSQFSILFLRQTLSLNLQLTNLVISAGPGSAVLLLSQLAEHWIYRDSLPSAPLCGGPVQPNSVIHVCTANALSTEASLSLPLEIPKRFELSTKMYILTAPVLEDKYQWKNYKDDGNKLPDFPWA